MVNVAVRAAVPEGIDSLVVLKILVAEALVTPEEQVAAGGKDPALLVKAAPGPIRLLAGDRVEACFLLPGSQVKGPGLGVDGITDNHRPGAVVGELIPEQVSRLAIVGRQGADLVASPVPDPPALIRPAGGADHEDAVSGVDIEEDVGIVVPLAAEAG